MEKIHHKTISIKEKLHGSTNTDFKEKKITYLMDITYIRVQLQKSQFQCIRNKYVLPITR